MAQQPGTMVWGLSIVAEAEVIPAKEAELLRTPGPAKNYEITSERGPELVHFEETEE